MKALIPQSGQEGVPLRLLSRPFPLRDRQSQSQNLPCPSGQPVTHKLNLLLGGVALDLEQER